MKLIHTADLHLDSPICSVSDAKRSAKRRDEILSTFGRIVGLAENRGAQAILIAGDLFDANRITGRALNYVLDRIHSHPGLDFYYLRGNHDCAALAGDGDFPENLHLFDETLTAYQLSRDVILYGSENPYALAEATPFDPQKFNLAMLHGDLSDFAAECPDKKEILPIDRFARKNLNYLALGHIHSYGEYPLDERGIACYPGCPNGRGYDECGEKGVILLDIADGRLTKEFIPTADRHYHRMTVDVTDLPDNLSCLRRIREALTDIPADDSVRISLTGGRSEDTPIDLHSLADGLPDYFDLRLKDETVFALSEADLAGEISLRGEFLRLVQASDMSDEEKRMTVLCGLAALHGEAMPL
ncbi:MAG: exonuclease SbcCD subunit D [Eubacteriales bacterium]